MRTKKVAAIVGIGPGLGASLARRFAREAYSLALMARGEDKLVPVAKEVEQGGRSALTLPTDATDPAQVAASFSRVREELGDVQVLIYNAGTFKMAGIMDITPEEFVAAWRANCYGAFLAAQQVLPAMQKRGSGTILITGATAALRGSARFSCLAVGKFGLRALTQSLAREYGPQGIHAAHIIIDGQIDTPALRAAQPDRESKTVLNPDAIAETFWQLHVQDATAWTLEIDVRPALEKF